MLEVTLNLTTVLLSTRLLFNIVPFVLTVSYLFEQEDIQAGLVLCQGYIAEKVVQIKIARIKHKIRI